MFIVKLSRCVGVALFTLTLAFGLAAAPADAGQTPLLLAQQGPMGMPPGQQQGGNRQQPQGMPQGQPGGNANNSCMQSYQRCVMMCASQPQWSCTRAKTSATCCSTCSRRRWSVTSCPPARDAAACAATRRGLPGSGLAVW